MSIHLPKDERQSNIDSRKDFHSLEKYQFHHHFFPHSHNKTRGTLLSHQALAVYCFALIGIFGFFRFVPKMFPGVLGYASNIKVEDLLKGTNKKREELGLNDLHLNLALTHAAEKKAYDMFKKDYWAHVAPDGTEPWDFIIKENYDYSYAGENLAKNFSNSKEVVEAWYKSPSHRENLLNKNYDEIGFAIVNGTLNGYETTLVVQFFGKPRNAGQIASLDEEKTVLKAAKNLTVVPNKSDTKNVVLVQKSTAVENHEPNVLPSFDISHISKSIGLLFGSYIGLLLLLDIWYSKKYAIPKFTGHTFAHLMFLLLVVVGMWFALIPGKVL